MNKKRKFYENNQNIFLLILFTLLILIFLGVSINIYKSFFSPPGTKEIVLENDNLSLVFHKPNQSFPREAPFYLKKIFNKKTGAEFLFNESHLWELNLTPNNQNYNTFSNIILNPYDFPNVSLTLDKNNLTVEWYNPNNTGNDITESFRVKVIVNLSENFADLYIEVNNTDNIYAVRDISFPRLLLKPVGNKDILTLPLASGIMLFNPHLNFGLKETDSYSRHPGLFSMQFFSFYDLDKPGLLFLQTTDSQGYQKDFKIRGETTHTRLEMLQYPENNIVEGNDFVSPFSFRLSVLEGNWYDAARFYKTWAWQQPFAQRENIGNLSDHSVYLKKADLYFLLAAECSSSNDTFNDFHRYVEQGRRVQKAINSKNIISHWYCWHNNTFGLGWPNVFPIRTNVVPALIDAKKSSQVVIPYMYFGVWDSESDSYKNNNIDSLSKKLRNGTTSIFGIPVVGIPEGKFAIQDPSLKNTRTNFSKIAEDILDSALFDGMYLDVLSGAPSELDYDPSHGHPLGGGSYWLQGNRELVKEIKSKLRARDPKSILSSEHLSEFYVDLLDMEYYSSFFGSMLEIPIWQTVYHEKIFSSDLAGSTPQPDPSALPALLSTIAYQYHSGKIIGISNWFADKAWTVEYPINNTKSIELFYFLGNLTKSYEYARNYLHRGERLRPLPNSIESIFENKLGDLSSVGIPDIQNSIWKSNGVIGILITNQNYTSEKEAIIQLNFSDYGLNGTYTILETDNKLRRNTIRTVSSDFIQKVKVKPLSWKLLEIVKTRPLDYRLSLNPEVDNIVPTETSRTTVVIDKIFGTKNGIVSLSHGTIPPGVASVLFDPDKCSPSPSCYSNVSFFTNKDIQTKKVYKISIEGNTVNNNYKSAEFSILVDECKAGMKKNCEKTLGVCKGSQRSCRKDGLWYVWPICTDTDYKNYNSSYESVESSNTACSDYLDNDCDGAVDCFDPSCDTTQHCKNLNDKDNDSVPDIRDKCPNTRSGVSVNKWDGCPLPIVTKFSDNLTTNFTNIKSLINIYNLSLGIVGKGRIVFLGNITLLNKTNIRNESRNVDNEVYIQKNMVGIDGRKYPLYDIPAIITLFNLSFKDPQVLKDGSVCKDCVEISYSDGNFMFRVNGFSNYSARETPTNKRNRKKNGDDVGSQKTKKKIEKNKTTTTTVPYIVLGINKSYTLITQKNGMIKINYNGTNYTLIFNYTDKVIVKIYPGEFSTSLVLNGKVRISLDKSPESEIALTLTDITKDFISVKIESLIKETPKIRNITKEDGQKVKKDRLGLFVLLTIIVLILVIYFTIKYQKMRSKKWRLLNTQKHIGAQTNLSGKAHFGKNL